MGDPSYFPELCEKSGQVVRAIALLDHPIPGTQDTDSFQVIFPGASVNRQQDLYLFCCSAGHKVAPDGRYIAFLSTTVEGDTKGSAQEIAQRELCGGLSLLAPVVRIFYDVYDIMTPINNGAEDRVFISNSFDATSHFETAINDVLGLYQRITGNDLVLTDGPQQ